MPPCIKAEEGIILLIENAIICFNSGAKPLFFLNHHLFFTVLKSEVQDISITDDDKKQG